jgi:outer membrane protein assembly factor BamB
LVCIDPITGVVIWDYSINNPYGWLTAINDKVFYLEQNGELRIIDFFSGKTIKIIGLGYPFMGYILPYKNYLITGSWRGYTDLICLNLTSDNKIVWKRNTKSKGLKSYSLPAMLGNDLIFADNSNHIITKIHIESGDEYWTTDLPNNVGDLDLDYTFQIDKDKVVVYSKDGGVYSLEDKELIWVKAITHTNGILTIKPKILQTQYLFQDSKYNICSYDKFSGKLNWMFYSNHFQLIIPAIEINSELTLICLSMKRKMIVNKSGEIIKEYNPEKRYSSDLFIINGYIYYRTKSELKQLKIQN